MTATPAAKLTRHSTECAMKLRLGILDLPYSRLLQKPHTAPLPKSCKNGSLAHAHWGRGVCRLPLVAVRIAQLYLVCRLDPTPGARTMPARTVRSRTLWHNATLYNFVHFGVACDASRSAYTLPFRSV